MSCNNLGAAHANGRGFRKSYATGRKYYELACEHDVALSCNNLGSLYEYGNSVKIDLTQALEFYMKGCELEVEQGCAEGGDLIYRGYDRVPADEAAGLALVRKGCEAGNQWGCDWLDERDIPHTAP